MASAKRSYLMILPKDMKPTDKSIALEVLDGQIGESKNLKKMSPVRMISAGGFLAVNVFGNRASTEDIDYILDPEIKNLTKAEEKLSIAIRKVNKDLQLEDQWINDSMAVFAVGDKRKQLFRDSVEQNEVVFQGKHLVIYAVKWQWGLTRKLIRLGASLGRKEDIDLSDAVALTRRIVEQEGTALNRDVVKSWTDNIYTPIEDQVLDRVAAEYVKKYGTQCFL
ncbi:hypothetical protein D6C76_07906 [Aureobasidium pullulans]|nr:hypothetical protein D6C76_07906 [Aureobasidium pullulans]